MPIVELGFGERKTLLEWTNDPRCVVCLMTLRKRLNQGMDFESSLTTPSSASADRLFRKVEAFGETKTIKNWALDPRATRHAEEIYLRLKRGWEPERAISEAEVQDSQEAKPLQAKTYHGRTVSEWLRDPRCEVSRFTLERNFRMHMQPEQALTFRKRRSSKSEVVSEMASSAEALRLLAGGAELWRYEDGGAVRISLIDSVERWEISDEVFKELVDSSMIELDDRFGAIHSYKLKRGRSKRAAAQAELEQANNSGGILL